MSGYTPMIEQYMSVKKEYADCILFFRLGDFYEMFFEDAQKASAALDIVLTSRDGGAQKVPMCGIPYHAAEGYIGRLLEKGFRVAICEQVEDPKAAKGIVRREVIRIVTPGTALEESWLKEERNYLVALVVGETAAGLAFIDLSTGEFGAANFQGAGFAAELQDEFHRLKPSECLVPEWDQDTLAFVRDEDLRGVLTTQVASAYFDGDEAKSRILRQFGPQYRALEDLMSWPDALRAAGAVLAFVENTQRTVMEHIRQIRLYSVADYMGLDRSTRRNLELTANMWEGKKEGTLYSVLDRTCTSMGRRLLRNWIEQPLVDAAAIADRLDAVGELAGQRSLRETLQDSLHRIRDLERIASRIGAGMIQPRECLALAEALAEIPSLRAIGEAFGASLLVRLFTLNDLPDLRQRIRDEIAEEAPLSAREGGMIRTGYDSRVDELRQIAYSGDQWLIEYEKQQRESTGIKTLKVGYNRVFGYYIEVTRANVDLIPLSFVRKQTLVNAERYITDELKHFESQVLGAKEKLLRLELELYDQLRTALKQYIEPIQALAYSVAALDVLASLADAAVTEKYVRPKIVSSGPIQIKGGRHPVVEKHLHEARFVPNDAVLDSEANRIGIVTGPNMGGKSTYLRQVALIVLMAQIGSFVPAEEAQIGLVDRIFTRVGSGDDLAAGQSTFMMEMSEVANILRYATPKSLVVLDEVGRGTSTYDGLSLARAIVEYLAERTGPRVLFATHYHELTDLSELYPAVFNLCVVVKESNGEVIFLKKVLPGKADRSYGIHVAQMAGLPAEVTERAEQILHAMEQSGEPIRFVAEPVQPTLFGEETVNPVLEALKELNVNQLTPVDALNLIHQWQQQLGRPGSAKGGSQC